MVRRASYALWRFNWIHPFAGGNGRMSRAIAYMLVCMDHGAMLPGVPTMPHIIARRRDEYIRALQDADAEETVASVNVDSAPDAALPGLRRMEPLLETALTEQLNVALSAHMTSTSSLAASLTVSDSVDTDRSDEPSSQG